MARMEAWVLVETTDEPVVMHISLDILLYMIDSDIQAVLLVAFRPLRMIHVGRGLAYGPSVMPR
jgi:hypothetical protein